MRVLVFISIIGLALSAFVHFCMVFHIFDPPRELLMLIKIGILVVMYPAFIISRDLRNKGNIKNFKNAVLSVCPQWMLILTGILIAYALGGLFFFIFKRYGLGHINDQGIMVNSTQGFSGHWMAFYSLSLTLLYSCTRLKNKVD